LSAAEDILAEIERYEQRLSGILSRFRGHDPRSLGMAEADSDIYPQLVIEIAELLRDVLGPNNSYTANIRTWDNKNIVAIIRAAHTHLTRNPEILSKQRRALEESQKVQQVFIGHGRSHVWRELRDFLEKRLNLSVEEFNRVSAAGISTSTRLEEMLNTATFAFLVMTAEDETPDGKFRARMNVVHEAGLFQGKLGFRKAIILLEEGCEDFSNIHGLGHIPFPKGNITAKFEEIRQVLEREHIISP
jgi:predicted nucleotide-binding protein